MSQKIDEIKSKKIDEIKKKLETIRQKFRDGGHILSKINLGWFNSSKDQKDLKYAIQLANRGQEASAVLLNQINDAIANLSISETSELNVALQQGVPYTQTNNKVFVISMVIGQIFCYLCKLLKIIQIPFLYALLGSSIFGLIGITIYQGIKSNKNTQMIQEYIKIQKQVQRLQSSILLFRNR